MQVLRNKSLNLFLTALCLVVGFSSSHAFAQNRQPEWFDQPVFFRDFSADAKKCLPLQNQSYDPRELYLCTKRLSDAGDRTADILVAEAHWLGTGTSVNYKAAADLWEKSYMSGFINAAPGLSASYASGYGRRRDLVKAQALRKEWAIKQKTFINPRQIAGQIFDFDYPSECSLVIFGCKMVGEKITAEFTVDPQGKVSACSSKGENVKLKEVTCGIISRRFKYLPALDAEGSAISYQNNQNVNWAPPPSRPDLSAPATLATGAIRSDMVPAKIAQKLNGEYRLVLALKVDIIGKVSACKTLGGPNQLTSWVCQTARTGFRFEPAKSRGGRSTETNVTLNYTLSFGDRQKEPNSISPPPAAIPSVPAPKESMIEPAKLVDVNLETAIDRCRRIGFKDIEPGYRECVLEQIRLLSKAK